MDSEEKYLDIREKLRNLEQVKASNNFIHNLHHKIVEVETEKRKMHFKKFDEGKGGFLRNLFANRQYPWLIPAVGFTVIIFFVLYMTFVSKNASENNKEQLSTQKLDQPTENNSTMKIEPNENKELAAKSEDDNLNSGKKNLPKDEIKGNLKKEQDRKLFSQIETKKLKTDKDDSNDKSDKTKIAQNDYENKNLSKLNSVPESIEESESIKTEKSSRETTFSKEKPEETNKDIATEDEGQNRKLIEKLNAIDKVNLESLRDKVSNN
ncbi:MAG: hypothetical protein ABI840_02280 [bacterium]